MADLKQNKREDCSSKQDKDRFVNVGNSGVKLPDLWGPPDVRGCDNKPQLTIMPRTGYLFTIFLSL